MTFKKAFSDIFSDTMNDSGFLYNRKYGMFIRFVNNELLQYITFRNLSTTVTGCKQYNIFAGIQSVYTYSYLKKDIFIRGTDLYQYSAEFLGSVKTQMRYTYNDETMMDTIKLSLKETSEVLVPILNRTVDLDSYIEHCKKVGLDSIRGADDIEACRNDALVLFKADNHDDFQSFFQEILGRDMQRLKEGRIGGTPEKIYDLLYNGIIDSVVNCRDRVYENPELYERAMKELERRKEANLQTLREYGVI